MSLRRKILALSTSVLLSIATSASAFEPYPAPDYNSSIHIVNVKLIKIGERSNLIPEQPMFPMIPPGHVLVGIGARAGDKTVTTVHLMSRQVLGGGEFGPVETHRFGSKPDHSLEVRWVSDQQYIAIVGLEFRIDKHDDFTTMNVLYKAIDSNGKMSNQINRVSVGSKPNYSAIEAAYSSYSFQNKVITGVGLVNHDEDVDSMWIYEGVFNEL